METMQTQNNINKDKFYGDQSNIFNLMTKKYFIIACVSFAIFEVISILTFIINVYKFKYTDIGKENIKNWE